MKKEIFLLILLLFPIVCSAQKYSEKKSYSDGLAAVHYAGFWGFVDKDDKLVIRYAFDEVKPFNNGYALVKYKGKWIYINKEGKVVDAPKQTTNAVTATNNYSSSTSRTSSSSTNTSGTYAKATTSSSNNRSLTNTNSTSYSSNKTTTNSISSNRSNYKDYRELPREGYDGFKWFLITAITNDGEYYEGAKDNHGNTIIPLSKKCRMVQYSGNDSRHVPPFFKVKMDSKLKAPGLNKYQNAAYNTRGDEIIGPTSNLIYDVVSDVFIYSMNLTEDIVNNRDDIHFTSLGISLTKNGKPYRSNNLIAPSSDYYKYTDGYKNANNNRYSNTASTNTNTTSSNDNSALVGALGMAIIGVGVYHALSSDNSNNNSSNNSTDKDKTIRVRSRVKCLGWGRNRDCGYRGRVTAINGNKCSVIVDEIISGSWLSACFYLQAAEGSGWKNLAAEEGYHDGTFYYGRGTIIEVPIYHLQLDE